MNRVAVITDIHGNLPALEASLQASDAIGVDAVYCGADLVGYASHPSHRAVAISTVRLLCPQVTPVEAGDVVLLPHADSPASATAPAG